MFGERHVNLSVTDRAKTWIDRFKAQSGLRSPIVKLGWARWTDESADHWMIGLYDRNDVREGWLGIAPDLEFVVIQEWILDAVDNKTLDVADNDVVIE